MLLISIEVKWNSGTSCVFHLPYQPSFSLFLNINKNFGYNNKHEFDILWITTVNYSPEPQCDTDLQFTEEETQR